jgi:mono/diheme cytochrome c family protein
VEPGREVWGREPKPIDVAGAAEDLRIRLQVEPGRVGENSYSATVADANGSPAADVQRVQLRFSYVDQSLGRGVRTLDQLDADTYGIVASDLSAAGRWQVEVAVRRLNREDTIGAFLLDIGVPTTPNGGSAIALPRFSSAHAPYALGALVLAGLGLGYSLFVSRPRRGARVNLLTGSLFAALISAIALLPALDFNRDLLALRNPIPVTRETLERGQDIYINSGCVSCHGISGRGDGPVAPTLRPRPADFRVHMAAGHSDGQLFDWVTNGFPETAMPAFAGTLTETDRWYVITYIRSFAAE